MRSIERAHSNLSLMKFLCFLLDANSKYLWLIGKNGKTSLSSKELKICSRESPGFNKCPLSYMSDDVCKFSRKSIVGIRRKALPSVNLRVIFSEVKLTHFMTFSAVYTIKSLFDSYYFIVQSHSSIHASCLSHSDTLSKLRILRA